MPWPWDSRAALVDARFCARHTTTLTVTRSSSLRRHGFDVTDAAGGDLLLRPLPGPALLLGAASRHPLLFVEESTSLIGMGRWEAFRGRCARQTDRLFLAVDKASFFQVTTNVHVFLDGRSSGEGAPDMAVHGSYYHGAMTVSCGGAAVAQIDRKKNTFWGALCGERAYNVRVNPGVDQAFVVALTVVLDQMHNPDYDSRSSSSGHKK
ncbi:hypothetical protein VPH35_093608 [Triticum aestivum]|uniref:Uncharacterized protein n=2 Tax=Triticum TaxID=4564 RepID=A0A9R0XLB0_TRITD|nr:unnamed protein product [Triticum turgidum subsp. durum]